MKIEPPKTLEDFHKIKETIFELMSNPWCTSSMYASLKGKLFKVELKILELTTTPKR